MLSKNEDLIKVIDQLPVYACLLDQDLNIVWKNQVGLEDHSDDIGEKCFSQFNLDNEQCTFCPVVRSIVSKQREVSMIEIASIEDGKERLYEVTAIPILDDSGQVQSIFEIRKDAYTEKKDAPKVADKSFVKKNKTEIFSSNHLLDIVTNEFKEYMNRAVQMHGNISMNKMNQEQKMYMSSLRIALMKSQNVINNITIMRNIENGLIKHSKKKAVFKDIVTSKFSDYQNKAVINGNSLDYKYDSNIPSKLIIDKRKVELILSNLIDYSVTNTSNRYIQLTTSVLEESNDQIHISFKVQNIGTIAIHDAIQKDQDSFIKNNLALSVIHHLTLSQEGHFILTPVSGYGVDMEVRIEFKKPFTASKLPFFNKIKNTAKSVDKVMNNDVSTRKKILIAEDEQIGRITIEQMLKHDYEVILAKNGKVAVEKYFEENPDLVIMDIMMPIMNGFDAFDQIERNCIKRVPIIACTSRVINSEKEYLKSYGFDDYIAKPVNVKALRGILNRHLNV